MSTAAQIPVYASRLEPGVEELCFSNWTCHLSTIISDVWSVIVIGMAVGLVFGSFVLLKAAKANVSKERSRTAAERDAFVRFAERVKELPASRPMKTEPASSGGVATLATTTRPSRTLEAVRSAYRQTVMAVPHHEEEYDDSLIENMATEFGTDVASSVAEGTELSPLLKRMLASKARKSALDRGALLDAISREEQSLAETSESLSEVQDSLSAFHPDKLRNSGFSKLKDRWDELGVLEDRTTAVLNERQRHLLREPYGGVGKTGVPSLVDYLYQTLEVDHPVLATGAEILDQIRTSRATVSRVAATRS